MTMKEILNDYMCSLSEYEFIEAVAKYKMAHGKADIGTAMMDKITSMAKDFANVLVLNLMGTEHKHVNKDVLSAVELHLNGKATSNEFVRLVIATMNNSSKASDKGFGACVYLQYSHKFSHIANKLYEQEKARITA